MKLFDKVRKGLEVFGVYIKEVEETPVADSTKKETLISVEDAYLRNFDKVWEACNPVIEEERLVENFERKVGERFDYKGTTLEVVRDAKGIICDSCFFRDTACDWDKTGACASVDRNDRASIFFTNDLVKKAIVPKNLTKFPHYFAKVPNFTHLDIYIVSEMFKLNSYQHHSLKKLVAAGKRGSKDQIKDLQEAIATIEAWIEVIKSEEV